MEEVEGNVSTVREGGGAMACPPPLGLLSSSTSSCLPPNPVKLGADICSATPPQGKLGEALEGEVAAEEEREGVDRAEVERERLAGLTILHSARASLSLLATFLSTTPNPFSFTWAGVKERGWGGRRKEEEKCHHHLLPAAGGLLEGVKGELLLGGGGLGLPGEDVLVPDAVPGALKDLLGAHVRLRPVSS